MNEDTIYTWEVSTDLEADSFHSLHFDSVFSSSALPELQTAYLQPNLHVRCTAQAVDRAGVRGYSRTSPVVQLSRQRYSCSQEEHAGDIRGRISTYEGFVSADEVGIVLDHCVCGTHVEGLHLQLTPSASGKALGLVSVGKSMPDQIMADFASPHYPSPCMPHVSLRSPGGIWPRCGAGGREHVTMQ